ncbi:MAG: T9SS type A sorting domain-containing protein [Candidatus Latescibacteria bacterium]|nr:T9SS type A sorting domain-containing protein [Candidatus Latescibacterota bacterium]NIM21381.1 T9SS type A sorting domain-containing protein [Candidatus Latescibacterota bacterium]NIM65562.1 T9SS type A sorting domain-containing protein [Candidatus Latescibacterota bacterium]NIO01942.1 T9SS type A sorting domain-containing protein [Candidatus Latescibacterota bacterium]NIO28755.1 T9SS type A sorting domain-containing protein [Candidatus Latescibacterota bacterium]
MRVKLLCTFPLIWLLSGRLVAASPPHEQISGDTLLHSEMNAKKEMQHRWPGLFRMQQERKGRASSLQQGFDVLHYELDLEVDPTAETVSGTVAAKCSVLAVPITVIALDLFDNMEVSSARANGSPASFTHANDVVTVDLAASYAPGDTLRIAIDYSGQPDSVGRYGPFRFKTHGPDYAPAIFSISIPDYARTWWPCKDVLDDKATADIWITVPDTLVVASNGRLVGVVDRGNGKHRYEWRESYPISTYLISVAISNYIVYSDYYRYAPADSMEVVYFIYPEDSIEAKEDFNVTVSMIEFFSSVFGQYPFVGEKYGIAEASWGSLGMEHQTCTTYGSSLVRGDHRNDRVVAHELAHQWWGDFVTVGDWRDIWLSEGFATYAEALWMENTQGPEEYRDYMAVRDLSSGFPGSVYDPDDLFNITVYWKGAWVLHMLRRVMGDSAFFQALSDYASTHGYENALTADFQAVCESASGESLSWFFDQWVFGIGRPHYAYSWTQYGQGAGHYVSLEVKQIQSGGALFRAPLDIRFSRPGWDSTATVWASGPRHRFAFEVPGPIASVDLDPDGWILKRVTLERDPADLGSIPAFFLTNYPNPFNPSSGTRIVLHSVQSDQVEVAVFNVQGARVATLYSGPLRIGLSEIPWSGTDDRGTSLASGVYFIKMRAQQGTLSRKAVLIE